MNTFQKKTANLTTAINVIKGSALFAWIFYLAAANYYNFLIEAFLLSITVTVISYLVFTDKPNITIDKGLNSKKIADYNNKDESDRYLEVFFAN